MCFPKLNIFKYDSILLIKNYWQENIGKKHFRNHLARLKTRIQQLQPIAVKVLRFFCASLYVFYTFVSILHSILKFNLVRKLLTQLKIPLLQFMLIHGNLHEFFCTALYIRYKILYTPHIMQKFNWDKNMLKITKTTISRNYYI